MLFRTSLFVLASFALAASVASANHYQPMPMTQSNTPLSAFPAPAAGMKQFVINLPPQADEHAFRVGLTVGRYQQTDGVNLVRLGGRLKKKRLKGWGYTYYELKDGSAPAMTTRMGVRPGQPTVKQFVTIPEKLVRYNSRLPIVVYVPDTMEVRYRIYAAGPMQTASAIQSASPAPTSPIMPSPPLLGHMSGQVHITGPAPTRLPPGSKATIRLYDSLLMDTDSTYAVHEIGVDRLPISLPLPAANPSARIAGPAVGVSIRDANGRLLYINDTSTPLDSSGTTAINVIAVR